MTDMYAWRDCHGGIGIVAGYDDRRVPVLWHVTWCMTAFILY